jgi:hypothetical protein
MEDVGKWGGCEQNLEGEPDEPGVAGCEAVRGVEKGVYKLW